MKREGKHKISTMQIYQQLIFKDHAKKRGKKILYKSTYISKIVIGLDNCVGCISVTIYIYA
jgi:hypothetical protein